MPVPEPIPDLLKAVNEASGKAFALWITFLSVGVYLMISVGTTTHLQLLLGGAVRLPLLNVDTPLFAFYSFAPLLFVVLHLYLLVQLYLLARLLLRFDDDLRAADMIEQDRRRVRDQLDKFVFTQFLIGAPSDDRVSQLLRGAVWLSFVVGPMLLLLGFYVRFLPYHSYLVSGIQRGVLQLDVALLWQLWPKIDTDVQKLVATKLARWLFGALIIVPWVLSFPSMNLLNLELENQRVVDPSASLSLRGRDLVLGIFRGSDFRKADLSGANLGGADFTDARLANAALGGTDLRESILKGADLSGANFSGARFWHADITGADLEGATGLTQEQLDEACGTGAKLPPGLTLKPCPAK